MIFFADGRELRQKREDKCLSLAELSALSGVSKGSIGNFETGTRGLSRKAQRALYEALQAHGLQTSVVREQADSYIADIVPALKERVAVLETELSVARETIHNLSIALAAAKPTPAAPASGALYKTQRSKTA